MIYGAPCQAHRAKVCLTMYEVTVVPKLVTDLAENIIFSNLLCSLLIYFLNLDPGKKVAIFGILGRRFKHLLHQGLCPRHAA